MAERERQYLCIDLKSFYASVECCDRGLDPMTTRLVVADLTRTEKTICLAVSPAMKALGVRNRCRVFEIPKTIDYITASPRMARYIERSADIYSIYLKYLSPADIHVYSIDEAFMDVTGYLDLYGCTARELGERIRQDVVNTTGIPATCGLGTNLYLAKVALDITAKHSPGFFGELTEESYKATLWNHRPITDFWRVGSGTAERLARMGIHTMGQLAMYPEEPLYREFGVDAEILIDHAWGVEPVRMEHIKAYRSQSHSISNAQVLSRDYRFDEALVVAKEMAETVALELVERRLVAKSVSLFVGFSMTDEQKAQARAAGYDIRAWIRSTSSAGGSHRFVVPTNSRSQVIAAIEEIFSREVSHELPIHRLAVAVADVVGETDQGIQLDLLSNQEELSRERSRQEAVSAVRQRFGKNMLLKGIDLLPEATARVRNEQIGGHRSGT